MIRARSQLVHIVPLAVALAGCAALSPPAPDWPAGLPPRVYFERVHAADPLNSRLQPREEYLLWVRRFYLGWMLAPVGWNAAAERLLEDLPPPRYRVLAARLALLAQLVASEWAKHERARRIDTKMLRVWAAVARRARASGRLGAALDVVIADVIGVLDGELAPEAIRPLRYRAFIRGDG